jgi:hypothetical protein
MSGLSVCPCPALIKLDHRVSKAVRGLRKNTHPPMSHRVARPTVRARDAAVSESRFILFIYYN